MGAPSRCPGLRAEHPALRAPAMPRTDALCALALGAATALHSPSPPSPAIRRASLQPFLLLNSLSDSISRPKGTIEHSYSLGENGVCRAIFVVTGFSCLAGLGTRLETLAHAKRGVFPVLDDREFVSFKMHIKCLEVAFPHDFLGMMYVPPMQVLWSVWISIVRLKHPQRKHFLQWPRQLWGGELF